ncbi:MAG TPA: MarR family transcriptional regulator [Casimicrobiaceae bacterium]|jgi:DNA-binding MarR family transcriptional regulator|nr:MarR family transcriptional regulator [Casimicrobiaceae bacterium]
MRQRNFGFLLKDVSRRQVQRFEEHARALSLTLSQCRTLVRLSENEGASQARLAMLADVEPMTMVRTLDRMEADGLVERRADPADRRARRLYLTARGWPLVEEIWKLSDRTRAELFAGIGARERQAFMDVLERIHANARALAPLAQDAKDHGTQRDAPSAHRRSRRESAPKRAARRAAQ